MVSGFNTNVRHRGLLLHVQTEDSGRAHPHLITHVYHGGTIVASEKTDYADRLGSEDLAGEVRRRMEAQHRAMLRRLRRGELDARLVERLGAEALGPAADPAEPADTVPPADPLDAGGATATGGQASSADTLASSARGASNGSSLTGAATSPALAAAEAAAPTARSRDGGDAERPLDEVVLEYLVARARGAAAR